MLVVNGVKHSFEEKKSYLTASDDCFTETAELHVLFGGGNITAIPEFMLLRT